MIVLMVESIALGLGMLALSPLILLIALADWWKLWRHGPAPTEYITARPESAEAWIEKEERND